MVDRGGESEEVGGGLLGQVSEIFKLWHKVRDSTMKRDEFRDVMKLIRQGVKRLLEAGAGSAHKKKRHRCQNMLKLERGLWTFVRVEGGEPTNNNAERG